MPHEFSPCSFIDIASLSILAPISLLSILSTSHSLSQSFSLFLPFFYEKHIGYIRRCPSISFCHFPLKTSNLKVTEYFSHFLYSPRRRVQTYWMWTIIYSSFIASIGYVSYLLQVVPFSMTSI